MEQLGSHRMDFHGTWYLRIFWTPVNKIQVPLNSDKNNTGTLHKNLGTVMIISYQILLRMRNIAHWSCRENQNIYLMFNIFLLKIEPFMIMCQKKWYSQTTNDNLIHPFIPLARAKCDNSLPFSGYSSISLCYVIFPATLLQQLFFHPLSLHLTIYFLVYLSSLFPNPYIILFWELSFLPFSVYAQTNVIYLTLLSPL